MQSVIPTTRDLVLIGGGHAHALLLRAWGMKPLAGARLTLINPYMAAPYTGMLPGYIAGHYTREELDIDLVRLARFAGARLILDRAAGLDLKARTVQLSGRASIAYDTLSIDIGITSDLPMIEGFTEYGVAAKPLGAYAQAWDAFVARAKGQNETAYLSVIGAGVAGVELALAMAHRLDREGIADHKVTLLEARDEALSELPSGTRRRLLRALHDAGVTLKTKATITRLSDGKIHFTGGDMRSDFTVSAAGARPHDWLSETGLDLHKGYIAVGETLQSTSHSEVFAVGDCAHLTHAPRPKAGVFAVRQAPVLYDNLRAALSGDEAMRVFKPQRDYLKLISLGRQVAVGSKFGFTRSGRTLWRMKDRIDRAFMDKFTAYPAMPAPTLPATAATGVREAMSAADPLCGGCGAKVGGSTLRASLAGLPAPLRRDVVSGAGDDAAVLEFGDVKQIITTDHLRAFSNDYYRMAEITAVHALGDVWAMGAVPQAALASIVMPQMSSELQARTLAEIMDAAGGVFRAAGADIVGGHTSVGAELSIGFTVTGLCERAPITHSGAKDGDVIILTKPIGTGVILAGEMRGLAKGRDVEAAFVSMSAHMTASAGILSAYASAMTDVTGFGLAGHLLAILEASGVAAVLDLDAVPILEGALSLSQNGVRSSLWPDNHRTALARVFGAADGAKAALLYDPQTAGGLLATVAVKDANSVMTALHAAGVKAVTIGRIVAGEPRLTLV